MKDTFNTIKNNLYLRAKELKSIVIISVIVFIFGHAILRLVMEFDVSDDLTSFELGTVMTAMITFFTTATIGANNYVNHINYAISMGKRRRDIITAHTAVAMIKGFIVTSLIYIFHEIESYVCRTSYKHIPEDFNFDEIFTLEIFFVIIIFLVAIEAFMGSMTARFGQKTFWIMWVICVIGFTSIPSVMGKTLDGTATGLTATIGQFFLDVFNSINPDMLLITVCIVFIGLILLPYVLLRKHRVTL